MKKTLILIILFNISLAFPQGFPSAAGWELTNGLFGVTVPDSTGVFLKDGKFLTKVKGITTAGSSGSYLVSMRLTKQFQPFEFPDSISVKTRKVLGDSCRIVVTLYDTTGRSSFFALHLFFISTSNWNWTTIPISTDIPDTLALSGVYRVTFGLHWDSNTAQEIRTELNFDSLMYWLDGSGILLDNFGNSISDVELPLNPTNFELSQNYPNPFNPSTKIEYTLANECFVNLKVYDILGKEVAVLVDEEKPPGNYTAAFAAANLPSGFYFYRLSINGRAAETKKMILLR